MAERKRGGAKRRSSFIHAYYAARKGRPTVGRIRGRRSKRRRR